MRNTADPDAARRSLPGKLAGIAILATGLLTLAAVLVLLRFAVVTDFMYHGLVKDPERVPPGGRVILAPADGTVVYVKRVEQGTIPEIVKRGVPVPLSYHLKTEPQRRFGDGWLIGIYMNSDGVHVNRAPVTGAVRERIIFNGPHLEMGEAERSIILAQLVPGWVSLRKLAGLPPYAVENKTDFVLKSARETLVIEDERETLVHVVRIADYWVGKILTWVRDGQRVVAGERLGMITWGSQTDIFFEESPGLAVEVSVGEFVYGGETILATY